MQLENNKTTITTRWRMLQATNINKIATYRSNPTSQVVEPFQQDRIKNFRVLTQQVLKRQSSLRARSLSQRKRRPKTQDLPSNRIKDQTYAFWFLQIRLHPSIPSKKGQIVSTLLNNQTLQISRNNPKLNSSSQLKVVYQFILKPGSQDFLHSKATRLLWSLLLDYILSTWRPSQNPYFQCNQIQWHQSIPLVITMLCVVKSGICKNRKKTCSL